MDHNNKKPQRTEFSSPLSPSKWTVFRLSIMALLFGTSSWIALTGMWLEVPLLLQQLPESWSLPSHLNVCIQLANVGPFLYWWAQRKHWLNDIHATHLQLWIGMVSCFLLIFFWNKTVWLFGVEHSLMLFILTIGLALVDSTSSVTFLPFMARFDSCYMTPYLIGEGLSGFIPSMFVLFQGVGEEQNFHCLDISMINETRKQSSEAEIEPQPRSLMIQPSFSVESFFVLLLFTLFISYLSFIGLTSLPICQQEQNRARQARQTKQQQYKLIEDRKSFRTIEESVMNEAMTNTSKTSSFLSIDLVNQPDDDGGHGKDNDQELGGQDKNNNSTQTSSFGQVVEKSLVLKKSTYYYLLVLMFWDCLLTLGLMPSLQPYSALPYGTDVMHYVVILASLSYPAGCFYAMLVEHRSIQMISFQSLVATTLAGYIVFCAWQSPYPPFFDGAWHRIGSFMMVFAWIGFTSLASYAKTMITLVVCDYNNRKGMFWVGMNSQFGAAIGAFIIYFLINNLQLFKQCSTR